MIPKIIHQSAPKEIKYWHPIWKICHDSVKNKFKNFEHILWTDEKINEFIFTYYRNYYDDFQKIKIHIVGLDLFRYALLYKCGGIYIDMDMYCYENFYDDLNGDINLIESNCLDEYEQLELVQNSLMAAAPNQKFFKECFIEGLQRSKNVKFKKKINDNHFNVKYTSGPVMLKNMMQKFKNVYRINVLPLKFFNTTDNHGYEKQHKVRHMSSGMWGKEILKNFIDIQKDQNYNYTLEDYLKLSYLNKTKIDVDILDFHKTYKPKP